MSKDPYQYFRVEARELVETLGRGVLELERGGANAELVLKLLRAAHTLKGAARVVKQAPIAQLAHAFEEVLTPFREAPAGVAAAHIAALFARIDEIGAHVAALDAAQAHAKRESGEPPSGGAAVKAPATGAPATSVAVDGPQHVRVELGEMDALNEDISEVGVRLTALRRMVGKLGSIGALPSPQEQRAALAASERELAVAIDDAEREMMQLRDRAGRLRLLPAQTLFAALERAVRDAGVALGRAVRFVATGGEARLDASVLVVVRDALLHIVRNAVAHGVEPEAERVAGGKSPAGNVTIEVARRDQRIAFSCRDDGRGIDAEAVRRSAIARGLVTPAAASALDRAETIRLVLKSGVSTAASVTELAGRGVGLDAVQAAVAQLGGEVAIDSVPGRGTTITLSVPMLLSSLTALVVEAAGVAASLPLDAVRRTLRVAPEEIVGAVEHDAVLVDGEAVPFLPLATALRRPLPAGRRTAPWSAVVVEAGGLRGAIGVDRLIGTSPIVLRPLPRLAGAAHGVLGASLDAEGNPQLVLDPVALARAAQAGRGAVVDLPEAERPPVLVIDDSLTTRMLEQSILESAGYDVELATSAEEALELARARRYSLFIVDVEMPGMNGFQFLDVVRGDVELRGTPAILVTSRNSADDKRRGTQAGARAYIVKSEFHQGRLLETIRELVG